MSYQNPYNQYREQSIATMTKNELLLLVFEELVKRLHLAKNSLAASELSNYEQSMNRAVEIINYLLSTLDLRFPISRELQQLYRFFNQELLRSLPKRSDEAIDALLPIINDLKNTWSEAAKLSKTQLATRSVI